MNTGEILRVAAARVRRGWTQGHFRSDGDSKVCALGAIFRYDSIHDYDEADTTLAMAAETAVIQALQLKDITPDGMNYVPYWNDLPCQTAETVAQGLEKAADWWDLQQVPPAIWTHRESHGSSAAANAVAGLVE